MLPDDRIPFSDNDNYGAAPNFSRKKGQRQSRARDPIWVKLALYTIDDLPRGWRGTSEAIQDAVMADGLYPPRHPNAWGALVRRAIKLQLIVKTRETAPSKHRNTLQVLERRYIKLQAP